MIKRAANSALIGIVAAMFGFTGALHSTAVIAQAVCVTCAAFTLLSLLLSLFEEPSMPPLNTLAIPSPSKGVSGINAPHASAKILQAHPALAAPATT